MTVSSPAVGGHDVVYRMVVVGATVGAGATLYEAAAVVVPLDMLAGGQQGRVTRYRRSGWEVTHG